MLFILAVPILAVLPVGSSKISNRLLQAIANLGKSICEKDDYYSLSKSQLARLKQLYLLQFSDLGNTYASVGKNSFPKLQSRVTRMAPRSRPESLIQELQSWQDGELAELGAMITGLLESRQQEAVDASQERREDGTPLGKHGGRGHIELKMIPDAKTGKTYGPYRYLRYWGVTKKGTKGLKSVYLGKGTEANE